MEVWVQSLDDGSDGSLPDGTPQENEYREINFTLENLGSYWWFNATIDDSNDDQELVYMRIIGMTMQVSFRQMILFGGRQEMRERQ